MDPMIPGSSNASTAADPFKRNPDGTVPDDPSKAPPEHVSQPTKTVTLPATDAPKAEPTA
jgi:hypothetical protein